MKRIENDPEGWTPPLTRRAEAAARAEASKLPTFGEYADQWIATRKNKGGKPLAARTREHYHSLLTHYVAPTFGALPLDTITPGMVNVWYDTLKVKRKRKTDTGETTKAHAYSFGRAVMNTATSAHGPLVGRVNPFAVRGGGSSPSTKRSELATSAQMEVILDTIRPQWRLLVLLGLWTGLRYGEIVELRRWDIDLDAGLIRVRRAVSRSRSEGVKAKGPKSEAGNRDMHIPAVVLEDLRKHLHGNVTGREGLLFPGTNGGHLAPSTFYGKVSCSTCKLIPSTCKRAQKDGKHTKHTFAPREKGWYAARQAAGCPSLHFHDLRATGATLMAQQGATDAEVQKFLGDSTPQAAQPLGRQWRVLSRKPKRVREKFQLLEVRCRACGDVVLEVLDLDPCPDVATRGQDREGLGPFTPGVPRLAKGWRLAALDMSPDRRLRTATIYRAMCRCRSERHIGLDWILNQLEEGVQHATR
ncbi:MAG: site-specific integrase [Nocardioides sp.]|jgi:integrase